MTRQPDSGFTLVEVIVALAILAVMAGLAVISLGAADRGLRAETEAVRMAAQLRTASDRALLSGSSVALTWDDEGYAFGPPSNEALPGRRLPASVRLEGQPRSGRLRIDPAGSGAAAEWRIARGAEKWRVSFDGLSARVAIVARE